MMMMMMSNAVACVHHRLESKSPLGWSEKVVRSSFLLPRKKEDNNNALLLKARRCYSTTGKTSKGSLPPFQELGMPALSPTMTTGGIASWRVVEGQRVVAGDVLAEIQTDKATMEMESMEDGVVAKILIEAGTEDIEVGTPLLVMVEEEEDAGSFKEYVGGGRGSERSENGTEEETVAARPATAPKEEERVAASASASTSSSSSSSSSSSFSFTPRNANETRVFISPLARKTALEKGVDYAKIRGRGPNGRVTNLDVLEFVASGGAANAKSSAQQQQQQSSGGAEFDASIYFPEYEEVPISTIKKITAKRLTESKQTVPHFYLTVDVNMDAVNATRARMNALLEKEKNGKKISVNDFVVKASAAALRAVPEVNSSWMDTHVRQYKLADVCVAVQTDKGLMVPVVRSACCLGLRDISSEVKSLAEKAKMGKLQGKDISGGTFTVSNLGMFSVKHFAAIVNPPQAGILAVGGTRKEIVKTNDGMYKETNVMSATLSCDHRAVDGVDGAKWLGAFKSYMEDPSTMLL